MKVNKPVRARRFIAAIGDTPNYVHLFLLFQNPYGSRLTLAKGVVVLCVYWREERQVYKVKM